MAREVDDHTINRIIRRALKAIDHPNYRRLASIMELSAGAVSRGKIRRSTTTQAYDANGKEQDVLIIRMVLSINGVYARYSVDIVQEDDSNPRSDAGVVSKLSFVSLPFTPRAVTKILCPFLRGTLVVTAVETLHLDDCNLGNVGISAIVNALLLDDSDNNNKSISIKHLSLKNNKLTSNSLPHLMQLLLQHDSLLESINLDSNPGLFDNKEKISTCWFSASDGGGGAGVWVKALQRLGGPTTTADIKRDNTRATLIYTILCEKLPSCFS